MTRGGRSALIVPISGHRHLEVGQDLEEVRLELLVRPVDLVDQQDRRDAVGGFERLEERAADEEVRPEDVVRGRLFGFATGFEEPDLEHLARVVPLVDGRVDVQALVALEPDERSTQAGREDLGELRLADAGLAFEQQRPPEFQGEEDGRGERPVRDVVALAELVGQRLDGAGPGGPGVTVGHRGNLAAPTAHRVRRRRRGRCGSSRTTRGADRHRPFVHSQKGPGRKRRRREQTRAERACRRDTSWDGQAPYPAMPSDGDWPQRWWPASLLAAAAAGPASAAAQAVTVDRSLGSGTMDLGGTSYPITGVVNGTVTVTASAVVTVPVRETLAYDDGGLRQGGDVTVTRTVVPNGLATVKVTWTVGGSFVNDSFSKTSSCAISLTAPTTCDVDSDGIRIFGIIPVPLTPFIDMKLQASVKVTPDAATLSSTELAGVARHRRAEQPGRTGLPGHRDPVHRRRGRHPGAERRRLRLRRPYRLDQRTGHRDRCLDPEPDVPHRSAGLRGPDRQLRRRLQHAESFDNDLTDASTKVSGLGPIAANNVPPNADAGGPYAGLEGVPIAFSALGSTSICGLDSLAFRWDFSDGGVAFGPTPRTRSPMTGCTAAS